MSYPQEALCSLLHLRDWTDAQDLDDDCNDEFLGEGVVVAAPIHKTTQLLDWIGPDWSAPKNLTGSGKHKSQRGFVFESYFFQS